MQAFAAFFAQEGGYVIGPECFLFFGIGALICVLALVAAAFRWGFAKGYQSGLKDGERKERPQQVDEGER
jgi:hypothetical protein